MDETALAVARPDVDRSWRIEAIAALVTCSIVVGGLATFVAWRYGSASAALAGLQGHTLLADLKIKPLGDVAAGGTATVSYTIQNLSNHPIRLQGAQSSCTCSVVEGIPCVVEARGTRMITGVVRAGSKPTPLEGSFVLFTDDVDEPTFRLGYSGQVVATPADPVR